jgi:hypothetical protein
MPDGYNDSVNNCITKQNNRLNDLSSAWPILRELFAVGVAAIIALGLLGVICYDFVWRDRSNAILLSECVDVIIATSLGYIFGYIPGRNSAANAERSKNELDTRYIELQTALDLAWEKNEIYKEHIRRMQDDLIELANGQESGEDNSNNNAKEVRNDEQT